MTWDKRKPLLERVERLRGGRALVCLLNFDRPSDDPKLSLSTLFNADLKEALFRVLKESLKEAPGHGVDLLLYTRGGDTNGVWPIVSLLREFDADFCVLVPFRCHSAGTLIALGAKEIVLTPLSELSPIDPSTGNQFNPKDPAGNLLGISVEDVQAYHDFVRDHLQPSESRATPSAIEPFLMRLAQEVHPLALGNVHRVHRQIQRLAGELLALHPIEGRNVENVIKALTSEFQSHLHIINRHEAAKILGTQVSHASTELGIALDDVLRGYEDDFDLRRPFVVGAYLKDNACEDVNFVGGAVESRTWSYLFRTRGRLHQFSAVPPNVQVQIPLGQAMPLVAGLPREHRFEPLSQGWERNTTPQGVTK